MNESDNSHSTTDAGVRQGPGQEVWKFYQLLDLYNRVRLLWTPTGGEQHQFDGYTVAHCREQLRAWLEASL